MKYQIKQGQEHKFAITENITDEEEFLHPAFEQALYALEKIIANARGYDSDSDIELYGYSQNIIAFSGVRGMGKTSTMVSLSRAMGAGKLPDKFKSCRFAVLPPVDPTIMEKHQNIVKLLLSRMYGLAENTWRTAERTHYRNVTDAKKNELLTLFSECLSGLDAIKNTDTSSASNLSAISRISDSSILKRQLYDLVEKILAFTKQGDSGNDFLVIQLDDTDTSTSNCYEILEDLRKFLSIPNVIILMATDMKLLRTVILQHYIDEFSSSRKEQTLSISNLEKMESKYIDKIIPPTNVVHLPKLDECVVNYSDTLKLSYVDPSGANNLLFTNQDDDNLEKHLSAQELILRYVHRKTGIVFVASYSNYHSIIPTTLRGLSQFLAVLSSMKDIPQVTDFENQEKFRESVRQYIKVAEDNINRFEKYFLNEWAEAKLSQKQAAVLADIVNADPHSRFICIADSVAALYKAKEEDGANGTNSKSKVGRKRLHNVKDFESFVDFMDNCEKDYRQGADVYFFFAIKAHLTILNHKTALSRMKKAIDKCKERDRLIFDFSPDKTLFPDIFAIPNMREEGANKDVIFYNVRQPKKTPNSKEAQAILNSLYRLHYARNGSTVKSFALTNLITLAISLGDSNIFGFFSQEDQKWLYKLQMAALTVSINYDLHKAISFVIKNYTPKQYKLDVIERMDDFFAELDKMISGVNKHEDAAPPMLECNLHDLHSFIKNTKNETISDIIGVITKEIENTGENNLEEMYKLYKSATEINSQLQDDSLQAAEINKMQSQIAQLISKANNLYSECYPDKTLIDEGKVSKFATLVYAKKYFMNDFMSGFTILCKAHFVNIEDVMAKAEDAK